MGRSESRPGQRAHRQISRIGGAARPFLLWLDHSLAPPPCFNDPEGCHIPFSDAAHGARYQRQSVQTTLGKPVPRMGTSRRRSARRQRVVRLGKTESGVLPQSAWPSRSPTISFFSMPLRHLPRNRTVRVSYHAERACRCGFQVFTLNTWSAEHVPSAQVSVWDTCNGLLGLLGCWVAWVAWVCC
jgi:hypothetical protein